jgi:hypothetical protein
MSFIEHLNPFGRSTLTLSGNIMYSWTHKCSVAFYVINSKLAGPCRGRTACDNGGYAARFRNIISSATLKSALCLVTYLHDTMAYVDYVEYVKSVFVFGYVLVHFVCFICVLCLYNCLTLDLMLVTPCTLVALLWTRL